MAKTKKEQIESIVEIIKSTGNTISSAVNSRTHMASQPLLKYIGFAGQVKLFNKKKFTDAYINASAGIIYAIENNFDFYKNGTVTRMKDMLILKCKDLSKSGR